MKHINSRGILKFVANIMKYLKKSDDPSQRLLQTNDNNQLRKRSELKYVTVLDCNLYCPQFINF